MGEEKRQSARVLTEFALTLLDEKGALVDQHAVAHDVSTKGFKAEARVELRVGQIVGYRLALEAESVISGRARIVWCQRTDLSYWAGAQFLKMSWGDRRRIRRIQSPSSLDWNGLADRAITAMIILLVTLVAWTGLRNPAWRQLLPRLIPEAAAAVAMGVALRELLRWR